MPHHSTADTPPVAYSYVRFSTPDQAKGDSLRRQTQAAADWCSRNGVSLDASATLHDLGRSAFTGSHRRNPDRHALAAFLKLVETGKVPRGSFLIVEALDRLTREDIQPALLLVLNLLQAGIRIVQLKPAEMVFNDKSDTLPVMMMIVELARGHSESAMKSERNGKAWVEKRRKAREAGVVMTHSLPRWIEEVGGRLRLIPERAAVVKRIFKRAAAGYGQKLTASLLTREQVPSFGPPGHWNASYIWGILKDRRAMGEFQPKRKRGREKDGEPIPGYYPAAVTEEEWYAARAGAAQRRQKRGRTGRYVNVFAGMLRNARDGGTYYCTTRAPHGDGGTRRRVLINTAATEGRARGYTFPFATFEAAVLSLLAEIDPHDILNGDDGPDETLLLAGELAGVEARIAELEAELLKGDVASLARALRQLEGQKEELAGRLATARQKAAHPLSEAWGEARTLLGTLDAAPDPYDVRVRLRAALRRIVDSIWMLVVARGHNRLCAMQVWFSDGARHRDYLIMHRPPKDNGKARVEGGWWARSLASVAAPDDLDLRDQRQAEELAEALEQIDLAAVEGAPGGA
jgi:DNA invertase Pin-like site-specific DNA recombinase